MTDSMIEKVARVLFARMSLLRCAFDDAGPRAQEHYLSLAHAAIAAMREPTPEMVVAGEGVWMN